MLLMASWAEPVLQRPGDEPSGRSSPGPAARARAGSADSAAAPGSFCKSSGQLCPQQEKRWRGWGWSWNTARPVPGAQEGARTLLSRLRTNQAAPVGPAELRTRRFPTASPIRQRRQALVLAAPNQRPPPGAPPSGAAPQRPLRGRAGNTEPQRPVPAPCASVPSLCPRASSQTRAVPPRTPEHLLQTEPALGCWNPLQRL